MSWNCYSIYKSNTCERLHPLTLFFSNYCRPLHPLARGNRPRKMREDLPSARCLRQSSPKQKRRRIVGKQPPPEVWKEITFPMQITQGHCLIHALELASEFLPEWKNCRVLSKESCEVFDTRTRVVLWNNDGIWPKVEDFLEKLVGGVPDSLKLLEDQEVTVDLWRRHTTTYEFELSVAGGHRVWLRKLLHFQLCDSSDLPRHGFYQVGVPISLFRQLRSIGCFREQLLFFHDKARFGIFPVYLDDVLNTLSSLSRKRSAAASLLQG